MHADYEDTMLYRHLNTLDVGLGTQHSFVVIMLVGAFNKMRASVEAFTGYCGNFCEISLRAELWSLGAECGGWIRLGCGQRPTPTPATVSGHKM